MEKYSTLIGFILMSFGWAFLMSINWKILVGVALVIIGLMFLIQNKLHSHYQPTNRTK